MIIFIYIYICTCFLHCTIGFSLLHCLKWVHSSSWDRHAHLPTRYQLTTNIASKEVKEEKKAKVKEEDEKNLSTWYEGEPDPNWGYHIMIAIKFIRVIWEYLSLWMLIFFSEQAGQYTVRSFSNSSWQFKIRNGLDALSSNMKYFGLADCQNIQVKGMWMNEIVARWFTKRWRCLFAKCRAHRYLCIPTPATLSTSMNKLAHTTDKDCGGWSTLMWRALQ